MGGGCSDGGHSNDSLLSAKALAYRSTRKKDSDTMKSLGKVPSHITEWEKIRRVVFANVAAACGTPHMGTEMLMAAEDHD